MWADVRESVSLVPWQSSTLVPSYHCRPHDAVFHLDVANSLSTELALGFGVGHGFARASDLAFE